ncbi:tRNA (guanine-N(7)-)-methyltransferase non-catalytic subunit trm82 [Fusarium falciforme]|uniref:tRNA (Guanine-N(7)-)-methyltransferase non-catalytic subunit trm82 n=1 Tax=Fusarium falciforme TaxID=195108 RepID=A0A9W8RKI9_9HYPO|nr:TRNA (guanine-N(7)-)-methyltransferase non-catalytic subunit TRM82 [Fusarium falciforme]KAJ4170362.1 tRNA (guanine-N(7)-)-methyltransferase non-catalytic subunit trm82 [Fusarium falciforme]KAJ4197826.1 tRNA (guanine-N(7)-)-methyltransferase non-catalytic subunit trm82 [Fusarium falciforme]KAJ4209013.1 tRNA (guanine-N(7)-)-methyltransferase non-catalytic subunit trm82 [Fusarium falciforme]KAJ4262323.1 tRNA (guanine-N(7)-)-methyltransferase non-catalytic subunit trm82 [Fusarium falciforme]WAO
MKIPFNVVHVSGSVLFAARGGKIHSFSLDDGAHLSTWKHPDVDKVDAAVKAISDEASSEKPVSQEPVAAEGEGSDEPPAKRQKVEEPKEEAVKGTEQEDPDKQASGKKKGGKKSKNRNQPRNKEHNISRVPDRPVITHLTSTSDGSHVLAITGHDKAIWVFENDGKGNLTQLSKRTMPKRPSDVAIGPDSQIICADKFGDVYALPLLYDPESQTATSQPSTPGPAKPAYKPSANATTVHSKRNLRALNNQQRQMELATRTKAESESKAEVPSFEITLLLGHVSMLTSLAIAESEGRQYIITGDRDEHIRLSRYIPQAYVIEGFCFGHKEFISSMTVPVPRGDVLVSGGGDEDLFLWDWKASKLLSRKSILSLAQEILPDLTKVAVSSLHTLVFPHEGTDLVYILAICEGIPAIFSWQLTQENTLNHPAVIQVPGNPLDLAVKPASGDESPKIIAALDPSDPTKAKSLAIYSLTMTDEKLATSTTALVSDEDVEAAELDVEEKVVKSLLYNTENLRKQSEQEEEQGEAQGTEMMADAEVAE